MIGIALILTLSQAFLFGIMVTLIKTSDFLTPGEERIDTSIFAAQLGFFCLCVDFVLTQTLAMKWLFWIILTLESIGFVVAFGGMIKYGPTSVRKGDLFRVVMASL